MPKHFQEPWKKWDYIEDIILDLEIQSESNKKQLREGLERMTKKQLSILYNRIKVLKEYLKQMIKK